MNLAQILAAAELVTDSFVFDWLMSPERIAIRGERRERRRNERRRRRAARKARRKSRR